MPDAGRLSQDTLPHTVPAVSPLYPPPPWRLPGARILKLAFETDKDALLRWLPPSLTRSSPPYALITVARFPETPVGPFSLAAQSIGCRARLFIRALTLQAIVDSEPALAALREVWGFPAKLGRVRLTAGPRGVSAAVSRLGAVLARLRLARPQPLDPGLARFDPILNVRAAPSVQEGKRHTLLDVLQIDPEYTVHELLRGRGQLAYPSAGDGEPWHLLPNLNMIAATYTVADTELPLARFVLPY